MVFEVVFPLVEAIFQLGDHRWQKLTVATNVRQVAWPHLLYAFVQCFHTGENKMAGRMGLAPTYFALTTR